MPSADSTSSLNPLEYARTGSQKLTSPLSTRTITTITAHCYCRDHRHWLKPPPSRDSKKGKMAVDRPVRLWMQTAIIWEAHGVQWAMENPEGSKYLEA